MLWVVGEAHIIHAENLMFLRVMDQVIERDGGEFVSLPEQASYPKLKEKFKCIEYIDKDER